MFFEFIWSFLLILKYLIILLLYSSDKKFGGATTTLKYSKSVESSKAPYKYENDFNWLVNDSYEVKLDHLSL